MKLLRGDGPLLRIGHRGAALLGPANTIAAVGAALEHGVDLVELDVFGGPDGKLVLSHSRKELAHEPVTFGDMLAFLAERSPETGVLTDLKFFGRDRAFVDTLRAHGFVGRALASTSNVATLQNLKRLEPELALSRTYPRGRLYLREHRTFIKTAGPVQWALRMMLPHRVARLIEEVGASSLTLNHRVVTEAAVERCHELGVAVFAWTVNDRGVARRLEALGVDGVITDDPRILAG